MEDNKTKKEVMVQERYCYEEDREFTIHKTSMFSQGDGFIAYDSKGYITFRVHSYGPIKHPLLLMDHFGKPLFTLLPKRPTLHQRWEGFMGEKLGHHDQQPPIFSMWKSTMIGRSKIIMVEVHDVSHATYQIEGCFSERRCTIYYMSTASDHTTCRILVARIERKVEPTRKLVLGRDVFTLCIKAGFDAAFGMALVLALDRIDGDELMMLLRLHPWNLITRNFCT